MLSNSRLEAIYVINQRKAFYRQIIPKSSCARKETVDIEIFIPSRNSDRNIMQPVQPVEMNFYQSNTYRRDLIWMHLGDEPRFQERQQVKDQQSYSPTQT